MTTSAVTFKKAAAANATMAAVLTTRGDCSTAKRPDGTGLSRLGLPQSVVSRHFGASRVAYA